MRLLLILTLAATPTFAQVASSDPSHPMTADIMFGDSSVRRGGQWQSADLILTASIPRTVGYFFLHDGRRDDGHGTLAALAATHDWSARFFTYAAAGASLRRARFLPTSRLDLDMNVKLLRNRQLVATIGGTTARYPERHRDDVLAFGATYYAPLIFSYRHFENTSSPGRVRSRADLLQLALERPAHLSAYLRHSWGNEAYQLTNLVTPQNVAVSGHTTTLFVRRWLTSRGGFTAEIEQQSKGRDFRRFGGRLGAFYSF